jgi:two-component system, NtrC family, sensor kinase
MQEIARTMSTRFRRAGVALELDLASGVHMHSYPGALGQVVMNLASNTLDHGFADATAGRVVLSTRVQDAEHVTIVVEDNGSGIAPEILTRVFDPFFTTRLGKGGSGLGLSIVRNIVTQILGGTVEVTSEPGRQTRFEIRLPREAPESTGDEKGEVP